MTQKFLFLACALVIAFGVVVVPFPQGFVAIALVSTLAGFLVFIFRRFTDEKEFVGSVFLWALALRLGFGIFVQIFQLNEFFGGDAITYDHHGAELMNVWMGRSAMTPTLIYYQDPRSGAGWGMLFFTAGIYMVTGHNLFASQSICAVIGAAVAPIVFFCARNIYGNLRVAKVASIAVAIFPALIIWSSQLMKDGLLMFLLVVSMTLVIQLQKRMNYPAIAILAGCLVAIFSLRFYIFYMVVVAVLGSFLIGFTTSTKAIVRGIIMLAIVGVALTYFGVVQRATVGLENFADLERIQNNRTDLARRANSGFGEDVDVSTTEGAIWALPLGFYFIMLAPFPWHAANLRQAITIPDVLMWWSMLPLLLLGLIYTVRHRLRKAVPVLIFSLLLTLAYSLIQGNVGTAYRQRTQLQVFFFMLVGVGWTVWKERQENNRILRAAAERRLVENLRTRTRPVLTEKT